MDNLITFLSFSLIQCFSNGGSFMSPGGLKQVSRGCKLFLLSQQILFLFSERYQSALHTLGQCIVQEGWGIICSSVCLTAPIYYSFLSNSCYYQRKGQSNEINLPSFLSVCLLLALRGSLLYSGSIKIHQLLQSSWLLHPLFLQPFLWRGFSYFTEIQSARAT